MNLLSAVCRAQVPYIICITLKIKTFLVIDSVVCFAGPPGEYPELQREHHRLRPEEIPPQDSRRNFRTGQ